MGERAVKTDEKASPGKGKKVREEMPRKTVTFPLSGADLLKIQLAASEPLDFDLPDVRGD